MFISFYSISKDFNRESSASACVKVNMLHVLRNRGIVSFHKCCDIGRSTIIMRAIFLQLHLPFCKVSSVVDYSCNSVSSFKRKAIMEESQAIAKSMPFKVKLIERCLRGNIFI